MHLGILILNNFSTLLIRLLITKYIVPQSRQKSIVSAYNSHIINKVFLYSKKLSSKNRLPRIYSCRGRKMRVFSRRKRPKRKREKFLLIKYRLKRRNGD